ncbi:hypothetical protein [Polynucleobacter antarcticus]|uniref:hypothetical protein n=1 Tax=Polynucleobacter antarcticus TaxID=1743162 RepID=UPI00156E29AC|nr:hypothetical protein [Polynucleobacter antarcticus]
MANMNAVSFQTVSGISFKPLLAVYEYVKLLAEAFSEAKMLELKSRKTCGNW